MRLSGVINTYYSSFNPARIIPSAWTLVLPRVCSLIRAPLEAPRTAGPNVLTHFQSTLGLWKYCADPFSTDYLD